jgi:hypothetical protein
MPTPIVGRNVKVEVALTFASPISPTAVTKANPGAVTLTSHGLTDGAVGYWLATAGMIELDQQAAHVSGSASNTFNLSGLDTTDYSTFTAGPTFTTAATWGTVAEAGSYEVGGGEATSLPDPRLLAVKAGSVAGQLAEQNLVIGVTQQEINGAALVFIENAAKRGTKVLIKISRGSQVLRVAYGTPSIPGESVQANGLGTGTFNIICPGWVVKPGL